MKQLSFIMMVAAALTLGAPTLATAQYEERGGPDWEYDYDWWDGWEWERDWVETDRYDETYDDYTYDNYPYTERDRYSGTEWEYDYDWWDGWEVERDWSETLFGIDERTYSDDRDYRTYDRGYYDDDNESRDYDASEWEYDYDWWDGWEVERDWSETLFGFDEDPYDPRSVNLDDSDVDDYTNWYDGSI